MRHLLGGIAACQALGILVADQGWLRAEPAVVLVGTGLGLGLVWRRARSAACLAVAFAVGAASMALQVDASARLGPGPAARTLEGRVVELRRHPGGWSARLDHVAGIDGLAPPRIALAGRSTPVGIDAFESRVGGERVRLRARLRPVRGLRNPGARDREALARRAGIAASGALAHPALHARLVAGESWKAGLERWRRRVSDRLDAAGPGASLLRALALGDRTGLSPGRREALAALGVSHLLAVSGLHLAWVAAVFYAACRLGPGRMASLAARRDTRRLALCAGVAAAAGYALLAGWGVPVRRALVLLGALALGVATGRARARLEPLAGAACLILAAEPEALFAPGAQLSFAATAALVFAARRPEADGAASSLLRTSATALAATAPLAALHFGSRAPLALAANLVAVPWTGVVVLPVALASALVAALPATAWTDAVLGLAGQLAEGSLAAALWAAGLVPGAGGGMAADGRWILSAAALGLPALFARPTRVRVAGAAAVGLVLHFAPPAGVRPDPPRAVFLDVGQGDAVLVQGRRGTVLIDAGLSIEGGPDLGALAVVPALRALGVERLDLVVASHADLDHRGGLPAVLAALPVGEVWVPRGARDDAAFLALAAEARLRERGRGDPARRFGDLRVLPLWPPAAAPGLSRNDRSLVVRVEVAGQRVLLPGDLEAEGERRLVASGGDLRADVLKLPHHGSRSSSTRAFLAAVQPLVAVASAPCEGRFGMPHPEVVSRARRAGASLWWTGRDGAVLVGLAPGRLHVAPHARPRRCGGYHASR